VPNAGIYTADKRPKLAATALRGLLDGEWSTEVAAAGPLAAGDGGGGTADGSVGADGGGGGWLEFTGFYGAYAFSYTDAAGAARNGTVAFGRHGPRRRPLVEPAPPLPLPVTGGGAQPT
jgi:hypothetical protein